jgi:triphosphoribosyl-dephospho-CoA synthetase
MLAATGGVNTQKGLIFLMGILAAAAASAAKSGKLGHGSDAVLDGAAGICAGLVKSELEPLRAAVPRRQLTAGERLYLEHGVTGIRGEIEARLPAVRQQGLPCLRAALAAGLNLNDALVHALLALMTETEDTTVINRHGLEVLADVQQAAKRVLAFGGMLSSHGRKHVKRLDEEFIARNISPGGSADLLAATYFLHRLADEENLPVE